jgi:hypothetical protein
LQKIIGVFKIKEDEMVEACSTHVGEEKYTGVLMMGEPVTDHLENTRIDGKIIFKLIFQK